MPAGIELLRARRSATTFGRAQARLAKSASLAGAGTAPAAGYTNGAAAKAAFEIMKARKARDPVVIDLRRSGLAMERAGLDLAAAAACLDLSETVLADANESDKVLTKGGRVATVLERKSDGVLSVELEVVAAPRPKVWKRANRHRGATLPTGRPRLR